MPHWAVRAEFANLAVMTFGLAAPSLDRAREQARKILPFPDVSLLVTPENTGLAVRR